MKKQSLIWVILFTISLVQGQAQPNPGTLDSVANWYLNVQSATWVLAHKYAYTYDPYKNPVTISEWDGNAWVYQSRNSYDYNSQGAITQMITERWLSGSGWLNHTKVVNTYDSQDNLLEVLNQVWNGSAWVNKTQTTSTFSSQNQELSRLYQNWTSNAWVNTSKRTYTYDGSGNNTTVIFVTWNGSSWDNSSKVINTFDNSGNRLMQYYQIGSGMSWEDSYSIFSDYDSRNNRLSEIYQVWRGNYWDDGYQYFYTYDVNDNLIMELAKNDVGNDESRIRYTYDSHNNRTSKKREYYASGQWKLHSNDLYTYDSNDRLTSEVRQDDWNGNGWDQKDSTRYYYDGTSGITKTSRTADTFWIYPNPTSGKVTLSLAPGEHNIMVQIRNLKDQIVFDKTMIGNSFPLDFTQYPKGIYTVVVSNTKGIIGTHRIIFQ